MWNHEYAAPLGGVGAVTERTFMAAEALSVKDCLPVSDMVIWAQAGSDDRMNGGGMEMGVQ